MFERYKVLVGGDDDAHIPFIRAASAERCVDSATNWTSGEQIGQLALLPTVLDVTKGFSSASNGAVQPVLNLIISEDVKFLVFFFFYLSFPHSKLEAL